MRRERERERMEKMWRVGNWGYKEERRGPV
jgi:hypothetical protein